MVLFVLVSHMERGKKAHAKYSAMTAIATHALDPEVMQAVYWWLKLIFAVEVLNHEQASTLLCVYTIRHPRGPHLKIANSLCDPRVTIAPLSAPYRALPHV
jgi:hypothetical protein